MLFNEYIKTDSHTEDFLTIDFINQNWNKLSLLFSVAYVHGFKEAIDISQQSFNQSVKKGI